jgi:hypothetical protein
MKIKSDRVGAAPDPKFVSKNSILVIFVISLRPYSSDKGAQRSGPAA